MKTDVKWWKGTSIQADIVGVTFVVVHDDGSHERAVVCRWCMFDYLPDDEDDLTPAPDPVLASEVKVGTPCWECAKPSYNHGATFWAGPKHGWRTIDGDDTEAIMCSHFPERGPGYWCSEIIGVVLKGGVTIRWGGWDRYVAPGKVEPFCDSCAAEFLESS